MIKTTKLDALRAWVKEQLEDPEQAFARSELRALLIRYETRTGRRGTVARPVATPSPVTGEVPTDSGGIRIWPTVPGGKRKKRD